MMVVVMVVRNDADVQTRHDVMVVMMMVMVTHAYNDLGKPRRLGWR
jgi:hypothetical protein